MPSCRRNVEATRHLKNCPIVKVYNSGWDQRDIWARGTDEEQGSVEAAEPKGVVDNPLRERKGEVLNVGVEYCGDHGLFLVKAGQREAP